MLRHYAVGLLKSVKAAIAGVASILKRTMGESRSRFVLRASGITLASPVQTTTTLNARTADGRDDKW